MAVAIPEGNFWSLKNFRQRSSFTETGFIGVPWLIFQYRGNNNNKNKQISNRKIGKSMKIILRQSGKNRLCEHQVRLASNANVARTAPSETRGQNWIQFNFGVKQSPRNTVFSPRADQTYLFTSETKRSAKSLSVTENCVRKHFQIRTSKTFDLGGWTNPPVLIFQFAHDT